ncbi:MAG: class I SAM-dependent methyltransferase [Nitrospirae bacterium]|nr:class I SAM-dependent methyltransferase [Nitrospirota bacterium]
MQEGNSVLDAGCGSGSLLKKLSGYGCHVYGIEHSKEYVDFLNGRSGRPHLLNVKQIKYGSVTSIPFPDEMFDLVVSGDVLEHVTDDDKAVQEFYRVLKKGGVCAVSIPAMPSLWDISDEWAGHLRRYTRDDIVSLFEKQGFAVEYVRFWGFPLTFFYHRFIYLPYIKKKIRGSRKADTESPPDAGKHKLTTGVLRIIFRMDSFFRWIPYGIGLTLKARKSG